ncbi:hypothetical protein F5884DRAFT_800369 [Xylogone sp. PMI_703]|nr:hypothetical protein F5884DRAFT_800369 [Xylogone sp. PMI_703]
MPHKHTRKGDVKSAADLPPNIIAKPLPVSKSAAANGIFTSELNLNKRTNKKRKRNPDKDDDTPKQFMRLMAFKEGKRLPKGLDDGTAPKKKKGGKKENNNAQVEVEKEPAVQMPTIKPGERMSDFAARVDAALPVSGLISKTVRGGKDPLGLKVAQTKTEKRMHRMYDEWREEDRKIKEKRMEALELAEAEELDEENGQVVWKADLDATKQQSGSSKKNGKKRRKFLGEVDDGDDDPWAAIKQMRGEEKIGLNDVVQAPPSFSTIPKEKFKVKEGAVVNVGNVPKASGSLRRREELGEVRKDIVERYRQMMKQNRAKS